jgi:hypothetical protein
MGLPVEAFQETNFFTAPAFAVDGVILINQATVMAAGGFPYKITQPGSYKLSGNLVVTTAIAEAIVISSDDVTLDLNGFSISCNDPGGNGCANQTKTDGASYPLSIQRKAYPRAASSGESRSQRTAEPLSGRLCPH